MITLIVNSFSGKNWSTYALPTANGVNSPAFQLNVPGWGVGERGGGGVHAGMGGFCTAAVTENNEFIIAGRTRDIKIARMYF